MSCVRIFDDSVVRAMLSRSARNASSFPALSIASASSAAFATVHASLNPWMIGHRVHLLVHELLRLTEELPGEDDDGRRAVADFVILRLADVDEDARGGVVDVDGLEDRRAVVRDRHVVALAL